jgi:hypothetical protein
MIFMPIYTAGIMNENELALDSIKNYILRQESRSIILQIPCRTQIIPEYGG